MEPGKILKKDRVSSTVQIINQYIRVATQQTKKDRCSSDFYVMHGNTVEALISAYQNRAAKTALVIDDIGLQVVNRLYQEGVKDVTLCLTRIKSEYMNMVKTMIIRTFPNIKVNVIHITELNTNMQFDLIIANPPYDSTGIIITKIILDTIKFTEYVNLLPLKNYKEDLSVASHVDFSKSKVLSPFSFIDADIVPSICIISKNKINLYKSIKDLVSDSFIVDQPMVSFMSHNCSRSHYAIDNLVTYTEDLPIERTVIFHCFMVGSNHNCGWAALSSECSSNKYNFKNIKSKELIKNSGGSNFKAIVFNTNEEKKNFMSFITKNFSFSNRLQLNNFLGCRNDNCCFPKVDWTKPWTVDEILIEVANYSSLDIKLVKDTDDTEHNFLGDKKYLASQFPRYFNID